MSFLPSNNAENPPVQVCTDDPERRDVALKDIIPSNPNKPYDVRDVIKAIVDDRHFLEVHRTSRATW